VIKMKCEMGSGRSRGAATLIAAALGLTVVANHTPARAASFGCAKAATAKERLVCSDPGLSKLDSDMGDLYRQALSQLSPAGGQRLKATQRRWLIYLNVACPLPLASLSREDESCVRHVYSERVGDLKLAAVRRGPYLFTRVDLYRATILPLDDSESPPDKRRALFHIAYPQIDHPTDVAARQWNRLVVQADPETGCEVAGDVTVAYKLGLATKRLISVTWTNWEYCHGTPHGHGRSNAQTMILSPGVRPLRPDDLFLRGRPWKAKLTALLEAAVDKEARDAGDADLARLNIEAAVAVAASPKRWSLTEEGLEVYFDPYELGEGYPFAPEIKVPWSALKDVLVGPPV